MKLFFTLATLLLANLLLAQPTKEEIKKHKIKKFLERRLDDGGAAEKFWYYDRKGYDSVQSFFNDTVYVKNVMKNGRLSEKIILKAGKQGYQSNDKYTYEYNPDGSYKEILQDGDFGMKSYEWVDKKGNTVKTQSPDGNTITYKYDSKGKLITVTSDGENQGVKINHKYSYNAKGQLVKEERNTDGNKSVTTYEYDAQGRKIKETSKGSWNEEPFEYISEFEYNEKGLLKKTVTKSKAPTAEVKEATTTYEYEYEFY